MKLKTQALHMSGFGRCAAVLSVVALSTASTQPVIAADQSHVAIAPTETQAVGNGENLRNIALIKNFYSAASAGDFKALAALMSADVQETFGTQTTRGPQGVINNITGITSAFPDMQLRVDSLIAQGDQIVARWSANGTHKGAFVGIPATQKRVNTTGVDMFRIKDGKVVEHQSYIDLLRLLEEMEIIKRR